MRFTSRLLITIGVIALLAGPTGLASASDPPSHEVTVPTTVGETVEVEWTGLMPPGAEPEDCQQAPVSDSHTIELAVPSGAYDAVRIQATFTLEYEGPAVDAKITVIRPDGSSTTGDGGFVDTDESVSASNPDPGTYEVRSCMFAGPVPQEYTGRLVLEAEEVIPTLNTGRPCTPPASTPKFEQQYVDETRAGGEPMVVTHPDGTLLWGSHAGTTHFFGPAAPDPTTAAFLENYEGQTYQYWSDDGGATWNFSPRLPNPGGLAGLPASGFSDPEFAIDAAGNVFISEINLANVAVSKSSDSGRTWTLQNITGFTLTDRQWNAADEEDVLYMTGNAIAGGTFPGIPVGTSGHVLTKSTDGGATWTDTELANPDGVGDIRVDKRDGTLYELSESEGTLSMAAFRGIRDVEAGFADLLEMNPIAEGGGFTPISRQIGPTFDIDDQGNLYVVWEESGTASRPQGIYYSYSTDGGRTWPLPIRVDDGPNTNIWPWIAVDELGEVSIVYLEYPGEVEDGDSELADPEQGWNVIAAHTTNALGCDDREVPGFTLTTASAGPVHYGTICNGGTVCQAQAVDRRLGDYFSNTYSNDGNMVIAVSDTNQGGAVSLPLVIRQVGGGAAAPTAPQNPPPAPPPPRPPPAASPLPTTGAGLAVIGLLLAGSGLALHRRDRAAARRFGSGSASPRPR